MRITLLRHGRPTFELSGSARAKDLRDMAKSYDASGITDEPPDAVIEAVMNRRLVICSSLARSLESARALGFDEIHISEPLFCEAAIPYFSDGSLTLPIGLWVVMLRILWLLGFSRNGESLSEVRRRARKAAKRLTELAAKHEDVLLVGHGVFNYFIAKALLEQGWLGPTKPGSGFWEYGEYNRPDA